MPTALFLSPHFDDVAFSCGGTLARLASFGWRCVLVTAFSRPVPHPSGFALACQLDKGLGADVDYMGLRCAEDDRFARIAGAGAVCRLDLAEAPHRGYRCAAELFGPPHSDDAAAIVPQLQAAIVPLLHEWAPDLVFSPCALGNHLDHVLLRRAVLRCAGQHRVLGYHDMPYALRTGETRAGSLAIRLDDGDLRTKLDGCAAYRSQLRFQFGDEAGMRAALTAAARSEARAADLGEGTAAERFAPTRR